MSHRDDVTNYNEHWDFIQVAMKICEYDLYQPLPNIENKRQLKTYKKPIISKKSRLEQNFYYKRNFFKQKIYLSEKVKPKKHSSLMPDPNT